MDGDNQQLVCFLDATLLEQTIKWWICSVDVGDGMNTFRKRVESIETDDEYPNYVLLLWSGMEECE